MTVSPIQPNSQLKQRRKNSESILKEQASLTSWLEFSSVCMKKPTNQLTPSNSLKSVWELLPTQTLNSSIKRTRISKQKSNSWKSKYRNFTRSWSKSGRITKSNNYTIFRFLLLPRVNRRMFSLWIVAEIFRVEEFMESVQLFESLLSRVLDRDLVFEQLCLEIPS